MGTRARWQERLEIAGARSYLAVMAGVFAAFHVLLYAIGIQFETYPLYSFLHFLDPELLKTRLLESCFYLHIQPPLFNLFCGIVLKLFPESSAIAFHAIYVCVGFLLYVTVFRLFVRMGIGKPASFVWSTLFMMSPAFILYEHWLFYTLPCVLLLAASALFLADSMDRGSFWAISAFFGCLLLLAGIRSSYHLLHFVVVYVTAAALAGPYRRRVIVIGLVPLLLIVGLYAKNYVLFGAFGSSTLLGKNFFINTAGNMGWEDKQRLVKEGKLSPLSLISRWNALDVFPPEYSDVEAFEDIPALRQISKSHGPHNYNHLAHIAISNQYMKDSLAAIRYSPKSFVVAMAVAGFNYFRPPSDYSCSEHNWEKLKYWKAFCDYALCGKLPFDLSSRVFLVRAALTPPYVFLLLGLPVLFLYGVWCLWKGKADSVSLTRTQRVLIAYFCFNISYVAALGTILDYMETYRYRFETDPFYLCLLALLVQAIAGKMVRPRKVEVSDD